MVYALDMTTCEIRPEKRVIQCIACLILQHLQSEAGDGDASVTVSNRSEAESLRDDVLRQCSWLKDCTSPDAKSKMMFHLSDMSNENIWITWDPNFDATLPPWVGLRLRWGHWQ